MPDNPRNFDDDLTPDWLQNSSWEQEQPLGQSGAGSLPPRKTSGPRGSAMAPWDRMPGGKAPVPPPPGHTLAPWIQLEGPGAPPPERAAIPWAEGPGGAFEEPTASPSTGHSFERHSGHPIGSEDSEIPHGLTGALPWMSAAEQQPSHPVQPSADDAAWLSGFGQAANFDRSAPTSDEMDLDWLRAEAEHQSPPPPAQPRSALDWLNDVTPSHTDQAPATPELPSWLDDEDTFGDQPEAAAPPAADAFGLDWLRAEAEQAPESAAESDLPPWLGDEDAFGDQPEAALPAAEEADIPWLAASGPGEPQAAWMSGRDEPFMANEPPGREEEDEGEMPWLADDAFDDGSAPPAGSGSGRGSGGDDPGWLYPEEEEPEEPEEEGAAANLPDWILNPRDEEPPAEAQPTDAPRSGSGIRRIRPSEEPEQPAEPEEELGSVPDWVLNPPAEQSTQRPGSGIRRIRPADEPEPPPYEAEGLTYDEWEQRQIEREREAAKTDADRMMEEVPDWFDQLGGPPKPEPETGEPVKPSGPEFMPGWFLGLEEQPSEEAPDWFKNIDYSADILAVPTIPDPTPPSPEQPEPSLDDVPDWFKGAADVPGSEEWASMFGAPQPPVEEEPERPTFKKKAEHRSDAEQPSAPEPEGEVPDWFASAELPGAEESPVAEADWMATPAQEPESAVPDLLAGAEEQLAAADWMTESEPEPEGELPDWLDEGPPPAQTPSQSSDVGDWMADYTAGDKMDEPSAMDDLPPVPDWSIGSDETEGAAAGDTTPADLSKLNDWMGVPQSQQPSEESWDFPLPGTGELIGRDAAVPGDVPDWLSEETPGGPDLLARPEDISFPEMDVEGQQAEPQAEDWMAGFTPSEAPAVRPTSRQSQEIEDFVERFDPIESDETPTPIDDEAPAWLRDMAASGEEPASVPMDIFGSEPEPSYGAGSLGDLAADQGLDWLTALSPEDMQAEPELPPLPPVEEEPKGAFSEERIGSSDIDQLLSLYQPPEPEPEPEPELELEPELDLELSGEDWPAEGESAEAWEGDQLDTLRLPARPDVLDEAVEMDLFADVDLAIPAPSEPSEQAPVPADLHPEWIAEMRPSNIPVTIKAGGAEMSITQKQVLDLPQRVRTLRDEALQAIDQPPVPPAASGTLAGINGALPLVDAVLAQERAASPARGLVITPEQKMRVTRLQNLLEVVAAEEDAAADKAVEVAPEKRARRRTRLKPDRLLVTVLMLIALIVPFASDTIHFADNPPALGGDRVSAAAAIDAAVQPNSAVTHPPYILFAFEYGPASAGELDSLAEAVLRDTIARGAVPITISTDPAGALHAEAVLDGLSRDDALLAARGASELVHGRDYFTLSYLPGEAMGVRSLRDTFHDEEGNLNLQPAFDTDLRGEETKLAIGDIEQEIALIVVIGEGSEDVRTWAEQLEGADVPKIALVTAAAEALVPPYINKDGYQGYLAGYRDTYRYNADRNAGSRQPYTVPADIEIDLPNTEDAQWHSLSLGAAAAAGLIALGMVINLFRAMIRRARR